MKKIRKILIVLMAAIMLCGVTVFATACGGESITGNYYYYDASTETLVKDNYIKLSATTWTMYTGSEEMYTGKYTVLNGELSLNWEREGVTETISGTAKNGVMVITMNGEMMTLYKDGYEPGGDKHGTPSVSTDYDGTYYFYSYDRLNKNNKVIVNGNKASAPIVSVAAGGIASELGVLEGTFTQTNGSFVMNFNYAYPETNSGGDLTPAGTLDYTLKGMIENGCMEVTSISLAMTGEYPMTIGGEVYALYFKDGSQPATPEPVLPTLRGTYYNYVDGVLSEDDYIVINANSYTIYNNGVILSGYDGGNVHMYKDKMIFYHELAPSVKTVYCSGTSDGNKLTLVNVGSELVCYKEGSQPNAS